MILSYNKKVRDNAPKLSLNFLFNHYLLISYIFFVGGRLYIKRQQNYTLNTNVTIICLKKNIFLNFKINDFRD
jgi:hypothetical protein